MRTHEMRWKMARRKRKLNWKLHYQVTRDGVPVSSGAEVVEALTIGRAQPNQIQLDDADVADVHAVLRVTPDGGLLYYDLASLEPAVYGVDRDIGRATLSGGEAVRIGDFELSFRVTSLEEGGRRAVPSNPGAVTAALTERSEGLVARMLAQWDSRDAHGVDDLTVPKVLEVFEIWGDTILSNRQFPRGARRVTLGDDPRRRFDFSVDHRHLPINPFPVVTDLDSGAALCFSPHTPGRVYRREQVASLQELIASGQATRDPEQGHYRMPLTEDTRFMLHFGQVVFAGGFTHPAKRPQAAGMVAVDTPFINYSPILFALAALLVVYISSLPLPAPQLMPPDELLVAHVQRWIAPRAVVPPPPPSTAAEQEALSPSEPMPETAPVQKPGRTATERAPAAPSPPWTWPTPVCWPSCPGTHKRRMPWWPASRPAFAERGSWWHWGPPGRARWPGCGCHGEVGIPLLPRAWEAGCPWAGRLQTQIWMPGWPDDGRGTPDARSPPPLRGWTDWAQRRAW